MFLGGGGGLVVGHGVVVLWCCGVDNCAWWLWVIQNVVMVTGTDNYYCQCSNSCYIQLFINFLLLIIYFHKGTYNNNNNLT